MCAAGAAIVLTDTEGNPVFAYDPGLDTHLGQDSRQYMGVILSSPALAQGETYLLWQDGTVTGEHSDGVYTSLTGYTGGTQMDYTGTDASRGPGGMGQRPSEGFNGERPEGGQEPPEGFDGERPEDGQEPPEGFDGEKPEDSREPPKI